MAACVTYLILLFAFVAVVVICIKADLDNVVPVCTDTSKTGGLVQIDTTMVPKEVVNCSCDAVVSGVSTDIHITYDGPDYSPCGIEFVVAGYTFSCKMDKTVLVDAVNGIHFSKNISGTSKPANFTIAVEDPNATLTVTCRSNVVHLGTTTTISSVTTNMIGSQKQQSTKCSYSVDSTSSDLISKLATKTTIKMQDNTSRRTTLSQSQVHEPDEDSHKVILEGAAGGGGSVLLLIGLTLLLYWCRNRVQKTNTDIPIKAACINSAADNLVTENVVYNMEFADESNCGHESLDEANAMCNSVYSHTQKQSIATNTIATYQNLQVDNDEETLDTNNFDSEQQTHNIQTVTQFTSQQLDEDGGTYNDVDFEDTTETQTKQNDNTQQSSEIDSELFYGQIENLTSFNINNAISKQTQETEVTYAVVNKNKPYDIGYERPKQFQVPKSDDTYALVNKESVK